MKKSVCLSGLAVALLGLGVARGQEPAGPNLSAEDGGPAPALQPPQPYAELRGGQPPASSERAGALGTGGTQNQTGGLTNWLVYPRAPGCCGPIGRNGPIGSEIYFRTGVSVPVGNGLLEEALHAGVAFQGGARVLFFNPEVDAAWTVDLSISNYNYNSTQTDRPVTLTNLSFVPGVGQAPMVIPSVRATVSGLNQTFANAAVGREWYLWGSAATGLPNWRVGVDGGGRYGTAKVDFNEIRHRTGAVTGLFLSFHSDFEYPCNRAVLQGGLRFEYGDTFSNILQVQNPGDLQTMNFLVTLGLRF